MLLTDYFKFQTANSSIRYRLLQTHNKIIKCLFITLDFRGFFTNGTSPLPLADFMDFRFGCTGVTSSSLASLSFVMIEGSVDGLDCLADLFPLNGRFGHNDELELLEDLDASLNEILITDRSVSVTNRRL